MPNLSNSPWIRGAPHRGLAWRILRTKSRSSFEIRGRPPLAMPSDDRFWALSVPKIRFARTDGAIRRADQPSGSQLTPAACRVYAESNFRYTQQGIFSI